jgi:hypothetical protein
VYSVPSRLIGTKLLVRLHAQTIEGYVGTKLAFTLPRLVGTHQHRIDYHHITWSLVRKPGAFAAYRYRDELFPTTTFRLAYDRLCQDVAARADGQYVRLLHLAASTRGGPRWTPRCNSCWKPDRPQRQRPCASWCRNRLPTASRNCPPQF